MRVEGGNGEHGPQMAEDALRSDRRDAIHRVSSEPRPLGSGGDVDAGYRSLTVAARMAVARVTSDGLGRGNGKDGTQMDADEHRSDQWDAAHYVASSVFGAGGAEKVAG